MDSLRFDAYGWLTLELVVNGKEVTKQIDLVDVYNRAIAAGAAEADAGNHNEAHRKRAVFFNAEFGTTLSSTDAWRLFNLLHAKVMDLKKKDLLNATAGTPSSTGSPPGTPSTPPVSFNGV